MACPSYPAVYLVCIAPISVSRWIDGSGSTRHTPAAVLFGHTMLTLSGVFNVILFCFTRPTLVTGNTETVEMHQSEDTRKVEDPIPPHRYPSLESNRVPGTIASQDSSETPTTGLNRLPHLQATFPVTKNARLGSHNHGRLPE